VSCGDDGAACPAAETPAVLPTLMPAAEAARRKQQPWRNCSHLRQDPRSYPWLLACFFISTVSIIKRQKKKKKKAAEAKTTQETLAKAKLASNGSDDGKEEMNSGRCMVEIDIWDRI
jgi:hypothetical protein